MLAQKVEKSGIDYYKNCIENSWDEAKKDVFISFKDGRRTLCTYPGPD